MIFLDAYALVALLINEPAADKVEDLLRHEECVVLLFNLAEAVDVTQRVHGIESEAVRGVLEPLLADRLAARGYSEADAWRAAELRTRHYDRKSSALSMADCFLLAVPGASDRIATSDAPVAAVARAEGVGVIALPDRTGRRP